MSERRSGIKNERTYFTKFNFLTEVIYFDAHFGAAWSMPLFILYFFLNYQPNKYL